MTSPTGLHKCDDWVQCIAKQKGADCVVVAVGNKTDLADRREVSEEEARAHFEAMNPSLRYFEVSAKTGEGVAELFEAVVDMVVDGACVRCNENTETEKSESRAAPGTKGGPGGEKCIIC